MCSLSDQENFSHDQHPKYYLIFRVKTSGIDKYKIFAQFENLIVHEQVEPILNPDDHPSNNDEPGTNSGIVPKNPGSNSAQRRRIENFAKKYPCFPLLSVEEIQKHSCSFEAPGQFLQFCEYTQQDLCESRAVYGEPAIVITGQSCIKQLHTNNMIISSFLTDYLNYYDHLLDSEKGTSPEAESDLVRHRVIRNSKSSSNPRLDDSIQPYNPFDVVIKCTLCGRLFSILRLVYEHLLYDHNHWYLEQDEIFGDLSDVEEATDDETLAPSTDFPPVSVDENREQTGIQNPLSQFIQLLLLDCIFHCEFCELVFANKESLFRHEVSHDPRNGFDCRACGIHVPNLLEIQSHWSTECVWATQYSHLKINLLVLYCCNVCSKTFDNLEQLYEHRLEFYHLFPRLSTGLPHLLVNCYYCGLLCRESSHLLTHHVRIHPTRKGVVLLPETSEIESRKTSHSERTKLCHLCGKMYHLTGHLTQHLRFHNGIKPFVCREESCSRRFAIRTDLNDHIRTRHTRERPYHCSVCNKRFLTGSVFYQHRKTHTGDRRFACKDCGKRFYRADALKVHSRIHTGEKPYQCMYCGRAFRQRGDCGKHIAARHKHQIEAEQQ